MIYAWYVKVAPGKLQTGTVKFEIPPCPGRLRVHGFLWEIKSRKGIIDLRSVGSRCMKGTEESLARVDSSVPLISWINDLFSGFPIETHSKFSCGEGRKPTGSGFTEGCYVIMLQSTTKVQNV